MYSLSNTDFEKNIIHPIHINFQYLRQNIFRVKKDFARLTDVEKNSVNWFLKSFEPSVKQHSQSDLKGYTEKLLQGLKSCY